MGKNIFRTILVAASLFFMNGYFTQAAYLKDKDVILSTTTSTQDSGLLNALLPLFEKQSGYRVKTVAVGTGEALAMAAKGEADVVLVHAPSLERKYVAQGKLLNRRVVMYNDFIIIGPSNDPAKIKSSKTAFAALKLIEQSHAPFVSRGDNSGTHNLEKSLWKSAGITPKGAWYVESGQGMGATLNIANDRSCLHDQRPRDLPGLPQTVDVADSGSRRQTPVELLFRHRGESGERSKNQHRWRQSVC